MKQRVGCHWGFLRKAMTRQGPDAKSILNPFYANWHNDSRRIGPFQRARTEIYAGLKQRNEGNASVVMRNKLIAYLVYIEPIEDS
jgi:hypothetical protein